MKCLSQALRLVLHKLLHLFDRLFVNLLAHASTKSCFVETPLNFVVFYFAKLTTQFLLLFNSRLPPSRSNEISLLCLIFPMYILE